MRRGITGQRPRGGRGVIADHGALAGEVESEYAMRDDGVDRVELALWRGESGPVLLQRSPGTGELKFTRSARGEQGAWIHLLQELVVVRLVPA